MSVISRLRICHQMTTVQNLRTPIIKLSASRTLSLEAIDKISKPEKLDVEEKYQLLKSNPFYHKIQLSRRQWATTLVCGSILVPSRVMLIAALSLGSWIPYLLLVNLLKPQKMSASEKRFMEWFFSSFLKACGIFVKVEGGVIKRFCIIVDKLEKDSRRQANQAIVDWLDKRDSEPSLLPEKLVFRSEGWHTNGTCLLPFKTGAFKLGRPVQPLLCKWGSDFRPIMTYGQNISWFWTFVLTLAQPCTKFNMKYLPIYNPNEDEKKDPELYALNVSKLMALEAGIPLAEKDALHYLEEIKAMRDSIEELKPTGWKRLLTCRSELASHKRL